MGYEEKQEIITNEPPMHDVERQFTRHDENKILFYMQQSGGFQTGA
ncbi:MAG: hypothetical protein ABJB73_08750 [Candidatus Nitrosocosmicus sp.]